MSVVTKSFRVIIRTALLVALASLLVASLMSYSTFAAANVADDKCIVEIRDQGSIPPTPRLYGCIQQLRGQLYNAQSAEQCVTALRRSGYFENVGLTTQQTARGMELIFSLKAPPVILKKVEYGIAGEELRLFESFSRVNSDVLRSGQVYRPKNDDTTASVIEMFFRSRGQIVALSRSLSLNYDSKSAQLVYRVWKSSHEKPEPLLPPYGQGCSAYVGNENLTDIDDFTPVALVQRLLKLKLADVF